MITGSKMTIWNKLKTKYIFWRYGSRLFTRNCDSCEGTVSFYCPDTKPELLLEDFLLIIPGQCECRQICSNKIARELNEDLTTARNVALQIILERIQAEIALSERESPLDAPENL